MELVESFIDFLRNERYYSENTITAYQQDIDDFVEFLNESGSAELLEVDYFDVRVYFDHLSEKKYTSTTIARKISSLRTMYKYFLNRELSEENPFAYTQMKIANKKLPKFFYEQEIQAIFDGIPQETASDIRDFALLEVLYSTGVRVSELVGIKLNDIDFFSRTILIHGKGSKDRYVVFRSFTKEYLQNYIAASRGDLAKEGVEELFVNHHGEALTPSGVSYILNRIIEKSGAMTKIHPHLMRHTFATHLIQNGADLRSVQELLGHKNLSTTQRYTHLTTDFLQKTFNDAHPRAKKVSDDL
ncbi:MAG: tyrosine recombinase XerC [Lactobacillales bacterium]|jgi:integrase/recombinase XerC|nr:tyrosine recombinase XerC [Lactobacillales bacterium]